MTVLPSPNCPEELLPQQRTRLLLPLLISAQVCSTPAVLENVARLCCSQWGGVRNLLIPIGEDRVIEPLYVRVLLRSANGGQLIL